MFDQKITLRSSNGQMTLTVVAGTEGFRSATLQTAALPGQSFAMTEQEIVDNAEAGLEAWARTQNPTA